MQLSILLTLGLVLIIWGTYTSCEPNFEPCDSCGKECIPLCGTKRFKTCCLSYMRKRSAAMDLDTEQELMEVLPELAKYYPSNLNYLRPI